MRKVIMNQQLFETKLFELFPDVQSSGTVSRQQIMSTMNALNTTKYPTWLMANKVGRGLYAIAGGNAVAKVVPLETIENDVRKPVYVTEAEVAAPLVFELNLIIPPFVVLLIFVSFATCCISVVGVEPADKITLFFIVTSPSAVVVPKVVTPPILTFPPILTALLNVIKGSFDAYVVFLLKYKVDASAIVKPVPVS
jgi:hypothetical protein